MFQKRIRFGDRIITLNSTMELQSINFLRLFQTEENMNGVCVDIDYAPAGVLLSDRHGNAEISHEAERYKILLNPNSHLPITDARILSFLPMGRVLLEQDILILHASYLLFQDEAILFCGPSGVGKSTQADLWAKYMGAEVVNGDRTLLFRRDGRFYAGGYYQCGSSNICKNISAPIRAIVLLEQGDANHAYPLRCIETYQRLKEQLLSFPENRSQEQIAVNLSFDLISSVTVCGYKCVPDVSAVHHLKGYLYEK